MIPIDEKGWAVMKGRDEIADLSTFRGDDRAIYSLWKPSWGERLRALFGVPVVVGVLSERQPPITVKVGRENIPGLNLLVLALLVGSSACASKYSVSPRSDAANNEFALSGQPLISVTPKGRFIWRKKPEEVAVMLMTYAGNLEQNMKICQDELAKWRSAEKKPTAATKK